MTSRSTSRATSARSAAAVGGARRRVGFGMAGGGPLLTDVVPHDASRHVAANAAALVERAFDCLRLGAGPSGRRRTRPRARSSLPDRARASARASLAQLAGGTLPRALRRSTPRGPRNQAVAGERFAEAGRRLAREMDASVVLTGGPGTARWTSANRASPCRRTDAAARGHVRPRDPRGRPRAVPAAADRRHGADAPRGGRRHAASWRCSGRRCRGATRRSRRPPHRPRRPAVQPVQPDPPARRSAASATRPTAWSASPWMPSSRRRDRSRPRSIPRP